MLSITASFGVLQGMLDRRRIFSFSAVFSGAILVFIVPQAWAIAKNGHLVPPDIYEKGVYYTIVCIVFAYLGYGIKLRIRRSTKYTYDPNKMFRIGAAFVVIGTVSRLVQNLTLGGIFELFSSEVGAYAIEWRGLPVYLSYGANFAPPGLILVLISNIMAPSRAKVFVLLVGLIYPISMVIFLGRRSYFFFLVALSLFPLYYFRNYVPSRRQLAAGLVVAFLVIILFPVYREHMQYDSEWGKLAEVDAEGTVTSFFGGEREVLEYRYALLKIGYLDGFNDVLWGAGLWNATVRQFVPRGLVGEAFKKSLLVNSENTKEIITIQASTEIPFYVTKTGFGWAFEEFGYFGPLLFVISGMLFKHLQLTAKVGRSTRAATFATLTALLPALFVIDSWAVVLVRLVPVFLVFAIFDKYARVRVARDPRRDWNRPTNDSTAVS